MEWDGWMGAGTYVEPMVGCVAGLGGFVQELAGRDEGVEAL